MANVMSHKEWMKLTYGGMTTVRSTALKKVDAALLAYERAPSPRTMGELQKVLVGWMSEKGGNWKNSVRNKHNAVDSLYRQVTGLSQAAGPSAGLEAMKDEAHQIMLHIFRGAEMTWKNEFRVKLNSDLLDPEHKNFALKLPLRQYITSGANNKIGFAANSAGAAKAINSLAHASSSTSSITSKLLATVVPPSAQVEVMSALRVLLPTFEAEFAAAVTPLVGVLTAAGGVLWNTGTALHKQYAMDETRMHLERSLAGVEARSAVEALIRILERERNANIFSASVSTAELGGKIASLAMDGGTAANTAIGLAANVAKLLNIVRIVYRDVQEKKAANLLMRQGTVDIRIFEAHPLVGCYLICCLPTSALMGLIFERFGERGWMDVAERTNARHLDPLRAKARAVIKGHRFEIRSLSRFPGVLDVNSEAIEWAIARAQIPGLRDRYKGFGSSDIR